MKFFVIGISDNPQPFFPPEVLEIIRNGKVFSGGKRHHDIVGHILPEGSRWIDITVPLDNVFTIYKSQPQPIIVFASGDPLFFGFANTIRRKMPKAEIAVYPSFNSLQMLAHRLLMPYHDMRIVSLTGRPWQEFDRTLIEMRITSTTLSTGKIGVLTDREHTPAAIARRMLDYGYTYYKMYAGEHMGNPLLEKVTTLTLEEAAKRDFEHPNCIILAAENSRQGSAAPLAERLNEGLAEGLKYGIPDSAFELLDGREKMITKMPIRLLTLQALDLPHRNMLWDIGACTGSISIEARLLFPHLHVAAFEVRPECEDIINKNARRFGTPGIEVHIGDFIACCDSAVTDMPPDAVFIGGHGGRLKEIMAKVLNVLAPGGVIVMNSVTSPVVARMTDRPSSRQMWDEACKELHLKQSRPTRIVLDDNNPIEILRASL